jgi:site-specific DNA recombinase
MRTALYARVSTERQERQQTIDSQLAALHTWAAAGNHAVADEHVFRDEGYSGGRLDRPGLDALRDAVRDGAVEVVAVLAPDRLARRYAYQVLLLEEFRRAGCEVVFLHHPISDDPNDQLLLQIQGAIAEYERAVLGERFRRGKLQRARNGHYLGGRAPYGYRYVPRHDAVPGHLVVDEPEADLVRMLYGWLVEEQITIRQILKRLNAGPWLPRSGRHAWSPSVVHHILADPIYMGTAYANRYAYAPPAKPRTGRGPRSGDATCRRLQPREQWIPIPVPALVEQDTWDRAQAQLTRNAALSFRNNARHSYLLRCLLTCEICGLAMYGVTRPATARKPERQYYECHGKDCVLSARTAACPSRHVRAEEIEPVVWDHVAGLLADPDRLLAQFDHLAAATETGSARDRAAELLLRTRLERTARADKRLLDAYQAGAVSLAELSERRQHLAGERQALERQQQERVRLCEQRLRAEAVRTDLVAFCGRIRTRLHEATFADKQAVLQLVVERIIVGDGRLEIRHVVPLRSPPTPSGSNGPNGPPRPNGGLRSDGVHPAALPGGVQHLGDGGLQALMGVGDGQLDATQAAAGEAAQELGPEGLRLGGADAHPQHLTPAIVVDTDGDDHGDRDDAPGLADFDVGGIEPKVGPIAFQWTVEEGLDLVVEFPAQTADLRLGDPRHAHRLDQVIDRAGGDALDVGFLDHRGQRLFRHPAGFEEAREVTALAQLGDAQFDGSGAGFPGAIAIAIALRETLGASAAMRRAGQAFDFQLHQALGGEADHLAQEVAVGGLLQQGLEVHRGGGGHCRSLGSGCGVATKPYREPR